MYQFELKPFRTQAWEKEVEKIFDAFGKAEANFSPSCEIQDQEKSYLISVDIPGVKKEEIDIEVKDNHLYVKGERKAALTEEKTHVVRSEKRYGKFSRVFTVPQNVNPDAIEARFENGVLELVLPKEEKAQPKKISILGQTSDLKN